MWKRLFKLKRYFYVSYSHNSGFGSCSVSTNNGIYPDLESIKKHSEVSGACILNIIEMSKKDFNNLFSKTP